MLFVVDSNLGKRAVEHLGRNLAAIRIPLERTSNVGSRKRKGDLVSRFRTLRRTSLGALDDADSILWSELQLQSRDEILDVRRVAPIVLVVTCHIAGLGREPFCSTAQRLARLLSDQLYARLTPAINQTRTKVPRDFEAEASSSCASRQDFRTWVHVERDEICRTSRRAASFDLLESVSSHLFIREWLESYE